MASAEVPLARLEHGLPGRARLRIPARRGDRRYFREVQDALDLCRQLRAAVPNARTGSLLLHYEGELDAIWRFAEEQRLFRPEGGVERAPGALERMVADARQLDSWFRRSSAGDLDLGGAVTVVLLGLSVLQLTRGQVLAPAATLAWYAATLVQARAGSPAAQPSAGAGQP